MTLEAADFIARAHRHAGEAASMLTAGFVEAAARTAYLAGFHAAQAWIFDRTGRVAKTHKGVQSEFSRLTRGDDSFEPSLRNFLSRTYDFKAVADYGVGEDPEVTKQEADDAIIDATRLIAAVEAALARLAP